MTNTPNSQREGEGTGQHQNQSQGRRVCDSPRETAPHSATVGGGQEQKANGQHGARPTHAETPSTRMPPMCSNRPALNISLTVEWWCSNDMSTKRVRRTGPASKVTPLGHDPDPPTPHWSGIDKRGTGVHWASTRQPHKRACCCGGFLSTSWDFRS